MFGINLYEDYVSPKCGRCSELCNCEDTDEEDTIVINSEGSEE